MVCVFHLTIWRESTQYSSDPAFWDKGIEIIMLKEMQDGSTQATRDFDVCYVFNLKIWLRTSIVLNVKKILAVINATYAVAKRKYKYLSR